MYFETYTVQTNNSWNRSFNDLHCGVHL